jgi:ATPase subunit of ABC transporter with duplicated ATPase domains
VVSSDQKMDWVERINIRKEPDHDKLSANFKKERAIRKFAASAKVLDSREKRLRKIEKPIELAPATFSFSESENEKKDNSIVLKNVCFGYVNGFQSERTNLKISFGERVAILGDNGSGKSTLLKTIIGELKPISGTRVCGKQLVFGYLTQEHKNLLLDGEIASFSPGERVRQALYLLAARNVNVLVLDEPTNHLDLETIEELEGALQTYPGTILLVTHDRLFLERLNLTESFMLEDGKLSAV